MQYVYISEGCTVAWWLAIMKHTQQHWKRKRRNFDHMQQILKLILPQTLLEETSPQVSQLSQKKKEQS